MCCTRLVWYGQISTLVNRYHLKKHFLGGNQKKNLGPKFEKGALRYSQTYKVNILPINRWSVVVFFM